MYFEIIDFHTHPFVDEKTNICSHREFCNMSKDNTIDVFIKLGVSKICGSVIEKTLSIEQYGWEKIKISNNTALELWDYYGDFYVPGFHIHPEYIEESLKEIDRMHQKGIKLIGELLPHADGWDYSCENFSVLLDSAGKHNMIVSFHSIGKDAMDKMVKEHPDVVFVAAHPGEYKEFMRHVERMKYSENYYLDLSGYGILRHGMLRHAIDAFGVDRILFGTDYPTCNPGMYIGGVLFDSLITDSEKEKIFATNAKKLLGI